MKYSDIFCSVQLLSCVWLFESPWTAARQAPLSFPISQNSLKFMSIKSEKLSNHLILYHSLLLLPSVFPSTRVFFSKSPPRIRWPKYWSFSFSISPSNEYWDCFPLGLTGLISLLSKGLSRIFSSTAVQKHQFFGAQPSLQTDSNPGLTVNDLGWGNKRARMTKISSLYMVYPL